MADGLQLHGYRDALSPAQLHSMDNLGGQPLRTPMTTRDGRYIDTTGAFLVGQLEALDPADHMPLFSTTYTRDLPLRTDVDVAMDATSFTRQTFATSGIAGNTGGQGQKRSFIGRRTNAIDTVQIDSEIIKAPLIEWAQEIDYTVSELASSAYLNKPIDQQKINAMQMDHQLQQDAHAYIGWNQNGTFGLLNNPLVTVQSLPTGASGSTGWAGKNGNEIIADLTNMLYYPWASTGFGVLPNRCGLAPQDFSRIMSQQVAVGGTGGVVSIYEYFTKSNITQGQLEIVPIKWLQGMGGGNAPFSTSNVVAGTATPVNRAVVWNYNPDWRQATVRYPFTVLQRTPLQYHGIFHRLDYWNKFGTVETVYPESMSYFDY